MGKSKVYGKRNTDSVSKKIAIFFMKRITESVSQCYETEFVFRLKKIAIFFVKRITESVSQCYETESVFRFPYILTFFAAQLL